MRLFFLWGVLGFVPEALPAKPADADKAYAWLAQLEDENPKQQEKAAKNLAKAKDPSMAAALVELIFFSPKARPYALKILPKLLGEDYGADYKAWIEAIGRREDLTPKPGYIPFKASLYARLDPALAEFFTEASPRTIRPEEVVWGGVKKDGIPALEHAPMIPASEAAYLQDAELVFGVKIKGEARAYPHRILDWHEMANDTIAGQPVSLSYCTLCGSGILFATQAESDQAYTFGSSGLLYRSNKLMYDRQTNSLWSNLTGEPVWGPLVGQGKKLQMLPLVVTAWGAWKKKHPNTKVLSLQTGHKRDYRPGAAYGKYFASPDLMFPVWKKPSLALQPKDWIWILEVEGVKKAYPLQVLLKQPVLHDQVGEAAVVLLTDAGSEAVRAYKAEQFQFEAITDTEWIDQKTRLKFYQQEEALVSEDKTVSLERLPGHRAYWFGWEAFFPGAELYQSR